MNERRTQAVSDVYVVTAQLVRLQSTLETEAFSLSLNCHCRSG